ncbi:metallophosphoesterase family protein [Alkaliphilus transvaalensis]|uniref:metallophosphoesterase family protein n=1 Tax=Alkaliphilus transvaalensis TaxID=114628 RepID=UPI00047E8814|nr:metallophosphoesterase family protein [Alkaliphilus transvaalensis]
MKIAFITDIHSNIYALETVWKDLQERGLKEVYCLGDLVGYGPFPNEVIDFLKEKKVPTIQGNYDEKVGEGLFLEDSHYTGTKVNKPSPQSLIWTQENTTNNNKKWLNDLPKEMIIEIEGKKLLLVHGSPRRNNEYLYEESHVLEEIADLVDVDILLCGHTHKPFHKVIKGLNIINVGSVGKPKTGNPKATYAILEIEANVIDLEIIEVNYDYEKMAKAIENSGLPNEFTEKIRKGID